MAESTKANKVAIPPRKIRTGTYEGMFLFGSGASQDLQAAQNIVKGMIEKHGGEILVLKKWDERKLAYELNKQKRGVYFIAFFKAPTTALSPLDRDIRLSEDVIRAMITEADHLSVAEMEAVEPQPIVRQETPSWERGGFEGGMGGGGGGGRGGDSRGGDSRGGDRPARGPRRDEAGVGEGAAKD